jgi:hypothetical protein
MSPQTNPPVDDQPQDPPAKPAGASAPVTPPPPSVPATSSVPSSSPFDRNPAAQGTPVERIWAFIIGVFKFLWEIIVALANMLRATLMLFINTPPVLLPSVVHTSAADAAYNQWLFDQLRKISTLLPLTELQRPVLEDNWFSQMQWVENRATRERNANELIRWWQIILGVLIPVFIQFDSPELRLAASIAGVFVAVIVAVHQFRRPDERWRHYRMLSERYQMAFWDYVTLSGEDYAGKTHAEVFDKFNEHMNALRRDDVSQFFGEIMPAAQANTDKRVADMRASLENQGLLPRTVER